MRIKRVLIANRGEIACRIITTLRKMKIKSIAVYSDADVNSKHVHIADESFGIGPAPSMHSYLNIDAICEALIESNADAVHPGFGFLAENYEFAERVKNIGVEFIGPHHEVIKVMGDKIEAKKIAIAAGVNVINGYMGEVDDLNDLLMAAQSIGFPVIIKAAAGGGGRGMRVVNSLGEMKDAVESASKEATKSFGNGRVFIEKYLQKPRHIETQILSDKFGNIVCLGERECSIQRRYQKVIEESPSDFIGEEIRQKMYQQSIMLAKKVGYYSAGTVEFIVDQSGQFFFLEMNTRIQVEHPVTELVTGIDIVQEMVNIAGDQPLSVKQGGVKIKGHALEVRVCAENAQFLPSSGVITHYLEPHDENVRVDSGVTLGSEVTMFYDPMLAKVCTYGKDRANAISKMQVALRDFYIVGVENNVSFLQSIMRHPDFVSGDISTSFIGEFYPDGYVGDSLTEEVKNIFISVIAYISLYGERCKDNMSGRADLEKEWLVKIDNDIYEVIADYIEGVLKIKVGDRYAILSTDWKPGKVLFIANINDIHVVVKLKKEGGGYVLQYDGYQASCGVYSVELSGLFEFMKSKDEQEDIDSVLSPISGMISKVYVEVGDFVKIGQPLFIIEAMKMENTFYAKVNARVQEIRYAEGDNVNPYDVIVKFNT